MTTKEQRSLLKTAITLWGYEYNFDKLIEECSELIQAVLKSRHDKDVKRLSNVHEELADVEIMVELTRLMINTDLVSEYKEAKLERLKVRIEQYKKDNDL